RLRAQGELADDSARAGLPAPGSAGLQNVAARALHHAALDCQLADTVAKLQGDQAALRRRTHPPDEWLQHGRAGAPGDMKAWHRVAVPDRAIAASFGPPDDREEAQPLRGQPGAFLAGGKGQVSLGPLARPVILWAVERGGAHPVLERQIVGVADAHAALLRRIDQKQAAE